MMAGAGGHPSTEEELREYMLAALGPLCACGHRRTTHQTSSKAEPGICEIETCECLDFREVEP